jgi:hypothetical protein
MLVFSLFESTRLEAAEKEMVLREYEASIESPGELERVRVVLFVGCVALCLANANALFPDLAD